MIGNTGKRKYRDRTPVSWMADDIALASRSQPLDVGIIAEVLHETTVSIHGLPHNYVAILRLPHHVADLQICDPTVSCIFTIILSCPVLNQDRYIYLLNHYS